MERGRGREEKKRVERERERVERERVERERERCHAAGALLEPCVAAPLTPSSPSLLLKQAFQWKRGEPLSSCDALALLLHNSPRGEGNEEEAKPKRQSSRVKWVKEGRKGRGGGGGATGAVGPPPPPLSLSLRAPKIERGEERVRERGKAFVLSLEKPCGALRWRLASAPPRQSWCSSSPLLSPLRATYATPSGSSSPLASSSISSASPPTCCRAWVSSLTLAGRPSRRTSCSSCFKALGSARWASSRRLCPGLTFSLQRPLHGPARISRQMPAGSCGRGGYLGCSEDKGEHEVTSPASCLPHKHAVLPNSAPAPGTRAIDSGSSA